MNYYSRKTAIVTGGGSGIGRSICLELANAGATVFAADINFAGAKETADGAPYPEMIRPVHINVADNDGVRAVFHNVVHTAGPLDFCFNCAAICITGDLLDLTAEDCGRVIEVNLTGVINCTLAAYRLMAERGKGHIVNVSSIAGFAPFSINAPYSASKHGIVGFTESLRHEAFAHGVRVSLVCPGIVRTEFYNNVEIKKVSRSSYVAGLPKRLLTPDKAARMILKGVRKKKKLIVFPFHAKILRLLMKILPGVMFFVNRYMVNRFRSLRTNILM